MNNLAQLGYGILWLLAAGMGIAEFARSKGNFGKALMVFFGCGLVATFVAYPKLLVTTLPAVFSSMLEWFAKLAEGTDKVT